MYNSYCSSKRPNLRLFVGSVTEALKGTPVAPKVLQLDRKETLALDALKKDDFTATY